MKIEQKRKKNHFVYGKSGILGDDPSKFARVKTAKRAVWPCVCVYMVWVDGDGFGDGIDDVERCVWVCERVRGAGTGCGTGGKSGRKSPGPWVLDGGYGKADGESPPVHGFGCLGVWVARHGLRVEDGVLSGGKCVEMWELKPVYTAESPPVHGFDRESPPVRGIW